MGRFPMVRRGQVRKNRAALRWVSMLVMLRNAKSLEGFELHARDGKIGHVKDFLFDDEHWTVRYLVVDTGGWLRGRRVLISPTTIAHGSWSDHALPVDLTAEQVRNSPGIELEQPVSREDELALTQYYNWPTYWTMAGMADGNLGMTVPQPVVTPEALLPVREARVAHSAVREHHLRSVRRVRGFEIEARDGVVGPIADFVLDDEHWTICYLSIETGKLWPAKKVLLAPQATRLVGWERAKVWVELSRETIRSSPAYDDSQAISAEYQAQLREHYLAVSASAGGRQSLDRAQAT